MQTTTLSQCVTSAISLQPYHQRCYCFSNK